MKSLIVKLLLKENDQRTTIIELLKLQLQEDGGVISELIPEIEILIGKQKPVQPLDSSEDIQKRFFSTFMKFFSCFAYDHTLVLGIDDLQWADSGSLLFLKHLIETKESIFVIGAYRDNEVDKNHPLTITLENFNSIPNIVLSTLNIDDLNLMVSNTLKLQVDDTKSLSELIFRKTGGNPFFSREFINTLYEEEQISLKDGKWNWDVSKIEKMNYSSNVIDFMIKNLKKKPQSSQRFLSIASCIGNSFNVDELEVVCDKSIDIQSIVMELLSDGWIIQTSSKEYKFFHDRLQQASYQLNEENDRAKLHSLIGQKMLDKLTESEIHEHIFSIINHLNNGKSFFENKKELLKLNLIAAQKSMLNCSFPLALKFTTEAKSLLPENSFEVDYEKSRNVYQLHAKACFSNSLHDESESIYNLLLEKVKTSLEKMKIYSEFIQLCNASSQFNKSFKMICQVLQRFEFTRTIPPMKDNEALGKWCYRTNTMIHKELERIGGANKMINLPQCEDKEINLFHRIVGTSSGSFVSEEASPLSNIAVTLSSLYFHILHGLSDFSPIIFAYAGWALSSFLGDFDGYKIATVGEKLFLSMKNPKFEVSQLKVYTAFSCIFAGSLRDSLSHSEYGINDAITNGHFTTASYNMNGYSLSASLNGENYTILLPKVSKYQEWVLGAKNYWMYDILECQTQFLKDLTGVSKFEPKYLIPSIKQITYSGTLIYSFEGILSYLNEDYSTSSKAFIDAENGSYATYGSNINYDRLVFQYLALIQNYQITNENIHYEKSLEILNQLKTLSQFGSLYFETRYQLVKVVNDSLQKNYDKLKILEEFERIYFLAQKSCCPLISGVICELTLDFCINSLFPQSVCQMYFDLLIKIWISIGASSKTTILKRKYSNLSQSRRGSSLSLTATQSNTLSESTNSDSSNSLDIMTIIKSSQALSGELTTSNLIKQVMIIIKENTGAESGALIMNEKNEFFVVSRISIDGEVNSNKIPLAESQNVCFNLVQIALVSKKPIYLNDAKKSEYSKDSYITKNSICSLCIYPIVKGKNIVALIYLENKSLEGIFDENRKQLLGHIGSQLTISYENATLYEDMNSLNQSYERFLPKEFLKQLGKGNVRNINKGDSSTMKMSVLFTDIRNFTTITEKMNPKESFQFINDILAYLSPVVSKNFGFVDKFVGDCIMALFPHDVDHSVNCGFELLEALEKYNQEVRSGKPKIQIGIGIHYGDVMLGTIGDEERIDATVISDTVNTASRVESFTKTLGATFLVTDAVISNCKEIHNSRYIGKYMLKGKNHPILLHHMIKEDEKDNFNKAIILFEKREFQEAQEIFQNIGDLTSKYLENISKSYKYYKFDDDWNGAIQIDKDGNMVELKNELLKQNEIETLSEDSQMKILEELVKQGKMKDFISLMSKNSPKDVNDLIEKFSK
jgi:predicted ATPase/class 3 adenylate cyclase